MKQVYICSPYSGNVDENVLYARAAMRDSLLKGEAPFAPHLLYTQPGVLADSDPEERRIGTAAGHAYLQGESLPLRSGDVDWYGCALLAVYYDRGISKGMMEDMTVAAKNGVPLEFRSIKKDQGVWATQSHEAQQRGLTTMWLDENERVRAGE